MYVSLQTTTKERDHFEFFLQYLINSINKARLEELLLLLLLILICFSVYKKLAVDFLVQKVGDHDNGNVLFKDCLAKTSESQDYQKLLSILYSPDDSNLGMVLLQAMVNIN